MSPEQAEGKAVDERSDVFSLGVVLYELATGVRPFTGDTHLSVLSSILRDTPAPVTERNPALPPDLAHIIDSCLAKDRHRRYQSANDLRTDLDSSSSGSGPTSGARCRAEHARRARPAESTPDIDSLAVLPFVNAGADPETEYLSDGITESLINRLSQIPRLRVVPRSTAFRYKGRDIDPNKAGRQLKVQALLTGKVLQRGDTLSVQAELVDVKQQAQLWGDRFVRRASDILAVEDEIAQQITDEPAPEAHRRRARTAGQASHREHGGLPSVSQGALPLEQENHPRLEEERRVLRAGDRAGCRLRIGVCRAGRCLRGDDVCSMSASRPISLSKAKTAARRALEVDGGLPEAHAELCLIWPCLDRDWDAADDAFRRAMQRKPAYWLAHTHYAMTLAAQRSFRRSGRGSSPRSGAGATLACRASPCGLDQSARAAIRRCDRRVPERNRNGPELSHGASVDGGQPGADRVCTTKPSLLSNRRSRVCGGASIGVAAAAHAYAMSGRTEEARRRLSELQRPEAGRYVQPYGIALVCAGARRIGRGAAMAGTGLSRPLRLVGLVGQSRSSAGCVAARRSIQGAATSLGTRIEITPPSGISRSGRVAFA